MRGTSALGDTSLTSINRERQVTAALLSFGAVRRRPAQGRNLPATPADSSHSSGRKPRPRQRKCADLRHRQQQATDRGNEQPRQPFLLGHQAPDETIPLGVQLVLLALPIGAWDEQNLFGRHPID